MIEIHEFSTGINFESKPDGTWICKGLTGGYMNNTLEQIPPPVEKAIASLLFAVTEVESNDNPTIIGRVIPSVDDYPDYSVVALVSCGTDESNRRILLYRYFIAEGDNSLQTISIYIQNFWKKWEQYPIFNPLKKNISPIRVEDILAKSSSKIPIPDWLNTSSNPAIIPHTEPINLATLNNWALQIAGSRTVAWAYNVKGIENPESFVLIYQASDNHPQQIESNNNNTSTVDKELVKLSVKSIANNNIIKPEAVKAIALAIESQTITQDEWESFFNSQGAEIGTNEGIYASNIMQVLTLRTMVLPETLPEYCKWYYQVSQKQPQSDLKKCVDFRQSLKVAFSDCASNNQIALITNRLNLGLKLLLEKLINNNITHIQVAHFLNSGFINKEFFIELVNQDLERISYFFKSFNSSNFLFFEFDNLWEDLKKYPVLQPKYKPLAELFEYLNQYQLSAYFYQISLGEVPKNIFDKAFDKCDFENKKYFYGIWLEKPTSLSSVILNLIGFLLLWFVLYIIFSIPAIIILAIGAWILSFITELSYLIIIIGFILWTLMCIWLIFSIEQQNKKFKKIFVKAWYRLEETKTSIKDLLLNGGTSQEENLEKILKILNQKDLKKEVIYNELDIQEIPEIEKWIKAIHSYQSTNSLPCDGVISKHGETYNKLKQALNS